jgi:environmental stress-induced protein Ves
MPRPQTLTHSSYRRVPWKNGLGSTLEIATDAEAPGGAWTWRLSFADVPARAAFSPFPGIDRHIAVLDGAGMTLEHVGRRIRVPREGEAYAFAGEDDVVGEPDGAGVRDANLMLDRSRWRGSLEIVRLDGLREITITSELSLIHFAHARDSAECSVEDESLVLAADSTLLCSGRTCIRAAHGTLVIACIERLGTTP